MTKPNTERKKYYLANMFILIGLAYIFIRACTEFYDIAWGTGHWLGEFSPKWGTGFFAFVTFCIVSWFVVALIIWKHDILKKWERTIVALRKKLGIFRWLIAFALLVFPVWFLQYTLWGIVFRGLYFRLFLWIFIALGIAVFMQANEQLLSLPSSLAALLLTSSVFSIAAALTNVEDYPFSIGWSEGNRIWDYSMMFGRRLYAYPHDQAVYVLLDFGRQFIGGLPFLYSGISIKTERLWVGLTTVFPYLLLGLAAFRFNSKDKKLWLLLALLTFIFLKQGPIHPPLVVCAFVVALLWRGPLWLAIPLIFVTGYAAEESRFTWLFAPAIWIVMLEFSGAVLKNERVQGTAWWRAAILGLSGALGGYFGSALVNWGKALFSNGETVALATAGGAVSVSSITRSMTVQPLLWYRLFPNSTYGTGILLALLFAVFPIISLLLYLTITKKWVLNLWQKLALVLPSLAFLVVGLIVSTKIGGGGDLHNLDMFLIGILFAAVIAWENGGRQWFGEIETRPAWVQGMLVLLLVIPGIQPLSTLRSIRYDGDRTGLVILRGVSDEKFLDLLPVQGDVNDILQTIRQEVDAKKSQGEILFMDQRQLLTFGYIKDVPFVPEYEKKVLMNEAMSDGADYFKEYYADLKAHRFSLIITEPLRVPSREGDLQFGEESDAWVKWVVEPTLCYYDDIKTWKNVQIQLLVPKQGNVDCSSQLPIEVK